MRGSETETLRGTRRVQIPLRRPDLPVVLRNAARWGQRRSRGALHLLRLRLQLLRRLRLLLLQGPNSIEAFFGLKNGLSFPSLRNWVSNLKEKVWLEKWLEIQF